MFALFHEHMWIFKCMCVNNNRCFVGIFYLLVYFIAKVGYILKWESMFARSLLVRIWLSHQTNYSMFYMAFVFFGIISLEQVLIFHLKYWTWLFNWSFLAVNSIQLWKCFPICWKEYTCINIIAGKYVISPCISIKY